MTHCEPDETPMDYTTKLDTLERSALVDRGRYQMLVGKLIYLSYTRPDISFSMNAVSQFMNNPTKKHTNAVY